MPTVTVSLKFPLYCRAQRKTVISFPSDPHPNVILPKLLKTQQSSRGESGQLVQDKIIEYGIVQASAQSSQQGYIKL